MRFSPPRQPKQSRLTFPCIPSDEARSAFSNWLERTRFRKRPVAGRRTTPPVGSPRKPRRRLPHRPFGVCSLALRPHSSGVDRTGSRRPWKAESKERGVQRRRPLKTKRMSPPTEQWASTGWRSGNPAWTV